MKVRWHRSRPAESQAALADMVRATVKGTAYSRAGGSLAKASRSLGTLVIDGSRPMTLQRSCGLQLDLQDDEAVASLLNDFKPDVVIHCAAERRPDAVEAVSRRLALRATSRDATIG